MFIGGSPASTSGGIKVVTLAIIITTVYITFMLKYPIGGNNGNKQCHKNHA